MTAEPTLLSGLVDQAPDVVDLTDGDCLRAICRVADQLLDRETGRGGLRELDERTASLNIALGAKVAVKLARSKRMVETLERPMHLSVVFAGYKEHLRILPRSEHPHGEDFLLRKVDQLRWLCSGSEHATWDLTMVDDGCPERSGEIAQQLIQRHGLAPAVRVLFLRQAIDRGLPVTRPLTSADQSQKGGSILYGMWNAAQTERPGHVVLFTDADLSTHLGQCGLLVDALFTDGARVAIGSRREPTSIVMKRGTRNLRGKLFIYLWKRLLRPLGYITDTQCGFKAFDAEMVRSIVTEVGEKRFAVDLELLLKSELESPGGIHKIPIAWIDSEAASTTTDLQPYLAMLRSVVDMYRRYLAADRAADEFAHLIDSLDEDSWLRMLENVPLAISEANPATFDRFAGISAEELAAASAP